MMIFRLALRNLFSAGLRTWLTSFVLALTLSFMIFMQGLMAGMLDEMSVIRLNEEIAGGQLWHAKYDPFDPTEMDQANAAPPESWKPLLEKGEACPLLRLPGAIYPKGRFKNTAIHGVDPNQKCLQMDFSALNKVNGDGEISIMVGRRYANSLGIKAGDFLTLRWRTKAGAFDALDVKVVGIVETHAPVMDNGIVYVSHEVANRMNGTQNHSTYLWLSKGLEAPPAENWNFRDFDYLMRDVLDMVQTKSVGQSIFWGLLLFLGLIAIFDTQALAVFRRKKEIGTFMAMGMSNNRVVYMFVMEGAMHGILATGIAAVVAGPLFWYLAVNGMSFGEMSGDDFGMAFGELFYPVFHFSSVLKSVLFVNLMIVLVSFWPTRTITQLSPAEALRGRMS